MNSMIMLKSKGNIEKRRQEKMLFVIRDEKQFYTVNMQDMAKTTTTTTTKTTTTKNPA